MLLVFLSPVPLVMFIGWMWRVTEYDREMRRIVRASIRRERMPKPKRCARWAGKQWQK